MIDEKGNRRGDMVSGQPPFVHCMRSAADTLDDDESEVQFKVKSSLGRTKKTPDPIQNDTAVSANLGARSKVKSDVSSGKQVKKSTGGENTVESSLRSDCLETTKEGMSVITHTPTKTNKPMMEMMKTEDVIKAKKEVDEKIAKLERQLMKMTSSDATTCVGGRRNRFRLAYDDSDSDEWVMEEFGETPRGKLSSGRSLPEFDGNNLPLNIFLNRFSNCAKYFKWDRPSRLYYLVSVLTGVPGNIVARNPDWTEHDIIRELKMRYGNANRALAFQKQLEAVRQAPGQKIQDVHEEASRLLALAFPGDKGRAVDVMGCNAFYRALANQEFSRALQTQYPIDLADALAAALALEPIYIIDAEKRQEESKRTARVVHAESELEKRLKQAEKQIAEQQRCIDAWKEKAMAAAEAEKKVSVSASPSPGASTGQTVAAPQGQFSSFFDPCALGLVPPLYFQSDVQRNSSGLTPGNQGHVQLSLPPVTGQDTNYVNAPRYQFGFRGGDGRGRGSGRGRGTRPPFKCWNCDDVSHYAHDCPLPPRDDRKKDGGASVRCLRSKVNGRAAHGVQPAQSATPLGEHVTSHDGENVYARARVVGRVRKVLFDTGCSGCLIPAELVKGMKLNETDVCLYSASGQKMHVLGAIDLPFVVAGVRLKVHFIVSDEIDDVMMGYGFMSDNQCEWLIGKSEMRIKGKKVKMISREGGTSVRRVYVRENTSVPSNASMLVAVRMPFTKVYAHTAPGQGSDVSWLLESTSLGNGGVFTAHTLLPHSDTNAFVSVINLGNRDYDLTQNRRLGYASEATVLTTLAKNVSFTGEKKNVSVVPIDTHVVSTAPVVSSVSDVFDARVNDQCIEQGVESLVEQASPDLTVKEKICGNCESISDSQNPTSVFSTDTQSDETDERIITVTDSVCGPTDCIEGVDVEVKHCKVLSKSQDYRCDDHVDCWANTDLCPCHGQCEFPSDLFAFCWACGCAEECDSIGKRKGMNDDLQWLLLKVSRYARLRGL